MTRRDIAVEFIERFCSADVSGLKELLAPDLKFRGPWFQFDSAQDYLESLSNDSFEKCQYRLISVTENDDQVVTIYDYIKVDKKIIIAQLFQFDEHIKINEMLLVFDGRADS